VVTAEVIIHSVSRGRKIMSSIIDKPTGRKIKRSGIGRKAAKYVPTATRCGFKDGRKMGNNAIENLPYVVGAVTGFTFGASEAIIELAAKPTNALFGLGVGLGSWVHQQFREDEVEVELA
jgi:hypothetical protein